VRFHQFIAAAWLALACAAAPAHAEKRVALVIGNDRYANLPAHEQLQKAAADARAVGASLSLLGFEVIAGENVGRQALVDRLDAFTRRLSPGDTAFFFFSGHGVALSDGNYILPSDIPNVEAEQETRLARVALAEHDIVSDLKRRGVRVAVVVLDACRTNPFARSGGKGVGGDKGLAPPPQVKGVFSLYAASGGQAARDRLSDDDSNPNSVFSRVLAPMLTRPGIDLASLAIEVREEVARIAKTAGYEQQPAYYDETSGGRVYLAGLPPASGAGTAGVPPAPPPAAGPAPDEVAWSFLKDIRDADLLRRFIAQYPASPHRREADERLKVLGQTSVAMTLPARPPETATSASGPCGAATVSLVSRPAAPLSAAEECSLKPKVSFRECADCPEMVAVPAGAFTMGSPEGEKDRSHSNEGPQHTVTISRPFAVGKLHVTRDQFAAFVRDTRYAASMTCTTTLPSFSSDRSWRDPGFAQDGSHPVVCIRWDDAKAYVDWVATKTGKPYRLLSEAEWEYAARGRTSPGAYPRFWFADDEKNLCRYGNFADQKYPMNAPCNDGYDRTSRAGHYRSNAFGLYDMAGNAWQWTADCWHESYSGAPSDGSAWTAGNCNVGRVVRGGSWKDGPGNLRAAARGTYLVVDNGLGFRLARTLTP
jgi:formylglycine-generating enzyme required for sulfatase activity